MNSAKYDLTIVKYLVELALGGADTVDFTARSRSVAKVIEALNCDDLIAIETILSGILKLSPNNFCRQHYQWGDVYDIYGLENYYSKNWFIKFLINDAGVLEEVSFHPCEENLALASGKVIVKSV